MNVTVTDAGEPWTPRAVTVTCPVYVPAVNAPVAAVTASDCGADPLSGMQLSQGWSVATVKFSDPPPVLVTLTFCDAGLAPACVGAKVIVPGLTLKIGCGGGSEEMVKVTVEVAGEPCAPGAVTVK